MKAIVVGIDEYAAPFPSLTTAVKDAVRMRDVLVSTEMCAPDDIELLTSPVVDGATLADRLGILGVLERFYVSEVPTDEQLLVYFAGHGLTVPTNLQRTAFTPVIVPCDVSDMFRDNILLIGLRDVLDRFRFVGPRDQYFIIDACRDLAYEESPQAIGEIGWKTRDQGADRRQAVLYAVAPFRQAVADLDEGAGVITSHVRAALTGHACATEFSSVVNEWGITIRSLGRFVDRRVDENLLTLGLAGRPQVEGTPDHTPLRVIESPSVQVALAVDAETVERTGPISLHRLDDDAVAEKYGEQELLDATSKPLRPLMYRLSAESGVPIDPLLIDPCGDTLFSISIDDDASGDRAQAPMARHLAGTRHVPVARAETLDPPAVRNRERKGTIVIGAHDLADVTVRAADSARPVKQAKGSTVVEDLDAGTYEVEFRSGLRLYSGAEVVVHDGSSIEVEESFGGPVFQHFRGRSGGADLSSLLEAAEIEPPVADDVLLALAGLAPFEVFAEWEIRSAIDSDSAPVPLPGPPAIIVVTFRANEALHASGAPVLEPDDPTSRGSMLDEVADDGPVRVWAAPMPVGPAVLTNVGRPQLRIATNVAAGEVSLVTVRHTDTIEVRQFRLASTVAEKDAVAQLAVGVLAHDAAALGEDHVDGLLAAVFDEPTIDPLAERVRSMVAPWPLLGDAWSARLPGPARAAFE